MKIQWIAHSCFLIEDSLGKRILTDPFHKSIGYEPYKESVQAVTISHNHFDHNNSESYADKSIIINKCGFHDLGFAKVHGFSSYHDNLQGAKRGNNIIFVYEIDGFRLCHLGDLGHALDSEYVSKLGTIDILFIPVGGHYTLDGSEAYKLCSVIKSSIVIPMHYHTSDNTMSLDGPEEFIVHMKNVEKIQGSTFLIESKKPYKNKVILLTPKEIKSS